MSPPLLVSIALLLAAFVASIVLWARSGEARVGWFAGLFLTLAAHHGISLWQNWGTPIAIDASVAAGFMAVLEGLLSVGIIVAMWRTLAERERVETVHWDSMEAVRVMNELGTDAQMAFDDKVAKLLEIGTKRYGLEVGMFSRVSRDRYEVLSVNAPKRFPVAPGAVFSLADTYCANTVESERPVGVERISESVWKDRRERSAFNYDAYLGAAVRVGGMAYGTLSFASRSQHRDRFTATDKDLVRLMAQWLGAEIERRDGTHAYVEPARRDRSAEPAPDQQRPEPERVVERVVEQIDPPAVPPSGRSRRVVDVTRMLKRLEKQLRGDAGSNVRVELKCDPQLGLAAVSRVPVDAIIRTLVANAGDAMPDGGELVIETANVEITAGEPGVVPTVAPDRYVTISVRDSGAEPDADTLTRLYRPGETAAGDLRDGRLALATIYRKLQNCGGDLSVDVERGRGSTFTVYLPRANDPPDGRPHAGANRAAASR